jgi:hypothetical protein
MLNCTIASGQNKDKLNLQDKGFFNGNKQIIEVLEHANVFSCIKQSQTREMALPNIGVS